MAGPQRKPHADIYTALLAIALVAILLSILFMYLETADYGADKYKGAPPVARLDLPATPMYGTVALDCAESSDTAEGDCAT
jgi:hypothetical protein